MSRSFSLRGRMLWSAALVLFVFLGLMGLVLDQAFQRTAEQSVEEKLRIQIYGLLSVTEVVEGAIFLPEAMQEPRFNNPGSGLFALVRNRDDLEVWRSPSAVTLELPEADLSPQYIALQPGEDRFARMPSANVFYRAYKVLWLGEGDEEEEFVFVVMESVDGYESQLTSFRNNLWGWLLLVSIALIVVQALVMNWGMKPLGELARDLRKIEEGKQDALSGDYPAELTGVTRNLNVLISSERTQRDKYRTTMADLAHSIKTPLAILKGSAANMTDAKSLDDVRETINQQVDRMDEIVGYQLERAMSNASSLIKRSIAVLPVAERLVEAMRKVYPNVDVDLRADSGRAATFFGDERDLMELLGNLVDNAWQYGRGRVVLSVLSQSEDQIEIIVADDGPGIPEDLRASVLERGARLDSKAAGQGIGLAVVMEIVDRYSGRIDIDASGLGGLRVLVLFG
jgi:two-component system sensor histidine kinase PhoQ